MSKKIFRMPTPMSIMGRTSSITNAFVNGIIPCLKPSAEEIKKALDILDLDPTDLRCSYCSDKASEWDHLRPLIVDKKPTGYISEIHNLVPSCGKCNQSKGNKNWKDWIVGPAKLSPKSRGIEGLENKIKNLKKFEKWKKVIPLDFESIVGKKKWKIHWENHKEIMMLMKVHQKHSDEIKKIIKLKFMKS